MATGLDKRVFLRGHNYINKYRLNAADICFGLVEVILLDTECTNELCV